MSVIKKLSTSDTSQTIHNILWIYDSQKSVIVNYLYFANAIDWGIVGKKVKNTQYIKSLELWDMLLPDGIALQMYYKKHYKTRLHNLNGTDFIDTFLHSLDTEKYILFLYGATKEVVQKAKNYAWNVFGIEIGHIQDGYSEFEIEVFSQKINNTSKIPILLLWLWTPRQEVWTLENRDFIEKHKLMVFSQGGTFDFWAGEAKRAPKWVRAIKLEWLYRFIDHPVKNAKKVWSSLKIFWYLWRK